MITLVRRHFWAIVFLVVLLVGASAVVRFWKSRHPGSMTVIESQAMDMTAMKPPEGAAPVATEIVHPRSFSTTVSYTGSVAPIEEQVIYPRVDGWLKDLRVYAGDRVTQGQLLATVDSPDLTSKVAEASAAHAAAINESAATGQNAARMAAERAASEAEVESAKSDIARAKADLTAKKKMVVQAEAQVKSAKANADYWRAEIERESSLLKSGAVSKQEYQSESAQATAAESQAESSVAALEAAKADIEASKAEVTGKQNMLKVAQERTAAASAAAAGAKAEVKQKSAMAKQAGAMADTASIINSYRSIRAPFAGAVTARYVSPGQLVTTSTAVLGIADTGRVRLQANVSDKDLNRMHVGDPVTARFVKDPSLIVNGLVTSVAPLANQDSRTSVVEAIVSNPGDKLVPGDSLTLEIAVARVADAVTVPTSAVIHKDDGTAVWVVRHETTGKTIYTCTMHPQIRRSKPGLCPICGMKLVPTKSSSGQKAHLVTVVLGQGDGTRVQVVSGLADGNEVIYQGNTYLKEGDTVALVRWTAEGPAKMPPPPAMGSMPGMDHGKSQGTESMPGMDHGKSQGTESMPGMDHSKTQGMESMPGTDHGKTQGMESMPGMKLQEKK